MQSVIGKMAYFKVPKKRSTGMERRKNIKRDMAFSLLDKNKFCYKNKYISFIQTNFLDIVKEFHLQ